MLSIRILEPYSAARQKIDVDETAVLETEIGRVGLGHWDDWRNCPILPDESFDVLVICRPDRARRALPYCRILGDGDNLIYTRLIPIGHEHYLGVADQYEIEGAPL